MSIARNLSVNGKHSSLSSLSSSMESLSSTHAESYWSIDQHELVPTSSAFTIPRPKVKTSDYDTGFSEYDDDKKQTKKVGRVKKAFSFSRTLRPKKAVLFDKESPSLAPEQQNAELMNRLAMLEEQVRFMGDELNKERQHREELEQKVENLQVENEQLQSDRKVAGEQLQKFYKKFFDSINTIPPHLMHNGLSTSTLNRSIASIRRSGTSINSLTSQ